MQEKPMTIAARIVNDAEIIAKSTLEEGQIKADEILERAKRDASAYISNEEIELKNFASEIIRQKCSATSSEVRKLILKAKKEAIDRAFESAQSKLLTLPSATYLELIKGMLDSAETQDTVLVYQNEKRLITKKFIEAVAALKGIKLKVDFIESKIPERGIKIVSDNVEKDCSLSTELLVLRNEIETQLVDVLFPITE
ncbi:MAG: hypothetical protein LBF12_03270 [Christensenellaceae bacterium]|jgi:vacuolar-type H+-ATPase subunit E/Vma4|nr:hypothetical protein [Christensenellaceae bacterium]